MTFIVVPHGSGDFGTRSFEVSYRRLRLAAALLVLVVVVGLGMALSWFYVAAQAARVPGLVRQVDRLEVEREQVADLAESLAQLEEQYQRVRTILGTDRLDDTTGAAIPETGALPPAEERPADSVRSSLPDLWPLMRRGFITREHLGEVPGQHPGIDIAVAEGSQVLAAGSGLVVAAGQDTIYGSFVRIRHPGGYETMYAHASQLFVRPGDRVGRGQVIALSGNTGRSTAPHLHFEILEDGMPIDPRTLVRPPGG